jgi:uncharacterized delta-60 repeat protein
MTFGSGGIVTTAVGPLVNGQSEASTTSVAVYPSSDTTGNANRIVVGGDAQVSSSEYDFAVARYNSDGSPDTTFNGTGTVLTSFGPSSYVAAVMPQGDGKVVAAGVASSTSAEVFALARYNANGTPDTTFGTNGKMTTTITRTVTTTTVDPLTRPPGRSMKPTRWPCKRTARSCWSASARSCRAPALAWRASSAIHPRSVRSRPAPVR